MVPEKRSSNYSVSNPQCVSYPVERLSFTFILNGIYLLLTRSPVLLILSQYSSPSILCRKQLMNVCSLSVFVFDLLHVFDPYNSTVFTLQSYSKYSELGMRFNFCRLPQISM